ncbi:haloacid dehalogenase-like hydrolase domain-containing protein Sgpp [Tanacetum coccineum]
MQNITKIQPEAIITWLQTEMNYRPYNKTSSTPSHDSLRRICRGNMIHVLHFLLSRIKSEKIVYDIRRNILVHGGVAKSVENFKGTRRRKKVNVGESEDREKVEKERDVAKREVKKLRWIVRQKRKELQGIMYEVSREECERKRMLDQQSNSSVLGNLCKWVKKLGLKRAAVTNAPISNAELLISTLKLEDFFEVIVLAKECARPKPFDPYLKTLDALNVSPHHTFVFEDSVLGIKAANRDGMPAVGMATRNPKQMLLDAGATLVIKDYNDLGKSRGASKVKVTSLIQYLTTGGDGSSCFSCAFLDAPIRETYQPRWDGWGSLDPCWPMYITIKDGGNIEKIDVDHVGEPGKCPSPSDNVPEFGRVCHTIFTFGPAKGKFFWDRQPGWSAYRESSFGHGILELTQNRGQNPEGKEKWSFGMAQYMQSAS